MLYRIISLIYARDVMGPLKWKVIGYVGGLQIRLNQKVADPSTCMIRLSQGPLPGLYLDTTSPNTTSLSFQLEKEFPMTYHR
jgi:hypothetical protein